MKNHQLISLAVCAIVFAPAVIAGTPTLRSCSWSGNSGEGCGWALSTIERYGLLISEHHEHHTDGAERSEHDHDHDHDGDQDRHSGHDDANNGAAQAQRREAEEQSRLNAERRQQDQQAQEELLQSLKQEQLQQQQQQQQQQSTPRR